MDDDFKQAGGEWREKVIDDYFEVLNGKRLVKNDIVSGEFPYVSSSSVNNGIQEYITVPEGAAIYSNCLSIAYNGLDNAVFYHPYKAVFSDNVRVVKYKNNEVGKAQYLFTANIFKKVRERFNYGNPMSSTKLRLEKIKLPFIGDDLAFKYMESYIKTLEAERIETLEAERIETLEAYLTVTGLKDYHLTEKDEKILDKFAKLSDTESRVEDGDTFWFKCNLKNLFGSATRGKRLRSSDRIPGTLPFVTAGEESTGISDYIGNSVEVFKKNSVTIDMFGSAKFRGYDYGADDHIAVVHTENIGRNSSLFASICIHKVSYSGQFSYSRNFYAKDADELSVSFPIIKNKSFEIILDDSFMSEFIRAVEKLVIKDLVEWTDKKIAATKEVVAR